MQTIKFLILFLCIFMSLLVSMYTQQAKTAFTHTKIYNNISDNLLLYIICIYELKIALIFEMSHSLPPKQISSMQE